jgi:DnaJ-class molecular chaperone
VPKGIEHEDIIRLVGKGRKKLNGASDVIVRVLLRPHP